MLDKSWCEDQREFFILYLTTRRKQKISTNNTVVKVRKMVSASGDIYDEDSNVVVLGKSFLLNGYR